MDEENLTLDTLFSMSTAELEQLMSKYSIAVADVKKLLSSLDLLSTYYSKYRKLSCFFNTIYYVNMTIVIIIWIFSCLLLWQNTMLG